MTLLLARTLPYAVAVLVVVSFVGWLSHARYKAGYTAAEAVMAESVRKAEALTRAAEAQAKSISEAKDREWQTQRSNLETRIAGLLAKPSSVRLCKPAGRSEVPAVSGAGGQPDGASGGGGQDMRMGEDIGPAALVLAGKCERDRKQLISLQAWVAAQANSP